VVGGRTMTVNSTVTAARATLAAFADLVDMPLTEA
jgi:hypothetical protein